MLKTPTPIPSSNNDDRTVSSAATASDQISMSSPPFVSPGVKRPKVQQSKERVEELLSIKRTSSVKEIRSRFTGDSKPETQEAFQKKVRVWSSKDRLLNTIMNSQPANPLLKAGKKVVVDARAPRYNVPPSSSANCGVVSDNGLPTILQPVFPPQYFQQQRAAEQSATSASPITQESSNETVGLGSTSPMNLDGSNDELDEPGLNAKRKNSILTQWTEEVLREQPAYVVTKDEMLESLAQNGISREVMDHEQWEEWDSAIDDIVERYSHYEPSAVLRDIEEEGDDNLDDSEIATPTVSMRERRLKHAQEPDSDDEVEECDDIGDDATVVVVNMNEDLFVSPASPILPSTYGSSDNYNFDTHDLGDKEDGDLQLHTPMKHIVTSNDIQIKADSNGHSEDNGEKQHSSVDANSQVPIGVENLAVQGNSIPTHKSKTEQTKEANASEMPCQSDTKRASKTNTVLLCLVLLVLAVIAVVVGCVYQITQKSNLVSTPVSGTIITENSVVSDSGIDSLGFVDVVSASEFEGAITSEEL